MQRGSKMANNEILDDGLDAFLNELKGVKPIQKTDRVLTVQPKNTLAQQIKKSAASDQVLKQTQLLGVLFFTIQLD